MQTYTVNDFTIYPLSEYAVTLEFSHEINADILQLISKFNTLLHRKPFDGFCTTVPAYATLSVFFDPLEVIQSPHLRGINCFERISSYLSRLEDEEKNQIITENGTMTIPICYGGKFGPDLDEVARLHGMTANEVIHLHSTAIYHVYLIGFTPGFAYLGGMPGQLATPRKSFPRSVVPAGSVGIAGKQTGIYSLDTPGGWQIIGRTPLHLFNPNRAQPALLKAGDKVVFKAMEYDRFEHYNGSKDADTYH
ncbi:5-oxoprolinase subunit PxpB [Parapedobacter tibetensis]|uniref:5-oxoprolinase subunit PxpB n=1 Tax=Parapedobacter tibetensis TaxID=2972951 RepID=UPI00214D7920|nr:5-oxoprolinase subunit PxpB [Parapedobacter tibetensis]